MRKKFEPQEFFSIEKNWASVVVCDIFSIEKKIGTLAVEGIFFCYGQKSKPQYWSKAFFYMEKNPGLS